MIQSNVSLFLITEKKLPSGFPRIKQNPKMKVVEKGRNAILVCEAEGDPPVNIYWVKDSIRLRRDPRFTVMQQGKLRGEREKPCFVIVVSLHTTLRFVYFSQTFSHNHMNIILRNLRNHNHMNHFARYYGTFI